MKHLRALGSLAGGFLLSPPPKSVIRTMLWIVPRTHPVVAAVMMLAVLLAWRNGDD